MYTKMMPETKIQDAKGVTTEASAPAGTQEEVVVDSLLVFARPKLTAQNIAR